MATIESVGPFEPPADYRFEEELQGEPPRPRHSDLRGGRYETRRRREGSALLMAAAICTAAGLLPITKEWGLYFLPLAYLTWIGLACGALAGVSFLLRLVRRGPYRYVEEGIPLVVRLRALDLRPTRSHNGQPMGFRYFATIEYRDPEAGDLKTAEVSSNELPAIGRGRLATTYRVGDYATAVRLPGRPEKSLRLYGFLDLRPGLGLVRRDATGEVGPIKSALTIATVLGLLGFLFWNVYAMEKYHPLNPFPPGAIPPMVAGAVLLGGGMLAAIAIGRRRERARRAERNAEAAARGEALEADGPKAARAWLMGLLVASGSLVLGAATMLCWCFTANALLDRSPPRYRPAEIDEMVQVTHHAIFREYKIEYHLLDGDPGKHEYLSNPPEMARFAAPFALAEVHSGRFGWPWVKALRPVALPPAPGPPGAP